MSKESVTGESFTIDDSGTEYKTITDFTEDPPVSVIHVLNESGAWTEIGKSTDGFKNITNTGDTDTNIIFTNNKKNLRDNAANAADVYNNTNTEKIDAEKIQQVGGETLAINDEESNNSSPAADDSTNDDQQKPTDGIVRFPSGIGNSGEDVIQFTAYQWTAGNSMKGFNELKDGKIEYGKRLRQIKNKEKEGSCVLPIPTGIIDGNGVSWGDGTLNPLEKAAMDIGMAGITDGGEEMAREAGGVVNAALNNNNIKNIIGPGFIGAALGKGQEIITRATGMVLNPNMELLFKGPTLRTFSFKFILVPRNSDEQSNAVSIIKFFKKNSAPQISERSFFLKSPKTFEIKYLKGDGDQPYLNLIKECACQSVSVNYTPAGNYATYKDGGMFAYELTLSFQELDPIYANDYDNGDSKDHNIGF